MFLTRSEYDRGVNTFSPEGRLFQVSSIQEWVIANFKLNLGFVRICYLWCIPLSR